MPANRILYALKADWVDAVDLPLLRNSQILLGLTSFDEVISFICMMPKKDMMQFRNLDRVCLNLLAYNWMCVGPPGTMTVGQITDCFADIPKAHIHKTLSVLDEKGFIFFGPKAVDVSLTGKGFDHIRSEMSKPVCSNARTDMQLT